MKKYFIDVVAVGNNSVECFARCANSRDHFIQMANTIKDIFLKRGYKLTNFVRKNMQHEDYIYYAINFDKEV